MKSRTFFSLGLILVAASQLVAGCDNSSEPETTAISIPSDSELNDLVFLREEEKLARDVYLYAHSVYGLVVFKNISSSEQTHMDRVLALLTKYGVKDPVSSELGVFTNPDLQKLYTQLVSQVDISMTDAIKIGATIEDLDIHDLDGFIAKTENPEILSVYNNLKCGSGNHLRSFFSQLNQLGESYSAQFISDESMQAILSTGNQRCGRL